MRAVRYDRFGPADVLQVVDLSRPRIGPEEVLVKVRAASAGAGETVIRAGRLRQVMRHRPPAGIGNDFTGRVEAVGSRAHRFHEGDAVWGVMPHLTFGSTAEYVAVPERLLSAAPTSIGLVEAAALPSSGTTVLTALTGKVRLRATQRLRVRGAGGGVGSIAVQLGRALGAHVTALTGARTLDLVRELGADEAVDYRTGAVDALAPFDVILDSVGTGPQSFRRLLHRDGRMIALALDDAHLVRTFAFIARGTAAPSRKVVSFSNDPSATQLEALARYVDEGAIRPVVDRVLPLDDAAEAHRLLEAGGVRGKHVIEVSP